MSATLDLTGQRFGRWTALRVESLGRNARWLCKCDCGRIGSVQKNHLRSGASTQCKSCSQKGRQNGLRHGFHELRVYYVWEGMKARCYNRNDTSYSWYGGRGITVCVEWHDAVPFIEWALANGYRDDLQIDRINNDGNYEPGNCRWATRKQQARNTRTNYLIAIGGVTRCLSEWEEISGIGRMTIRGRHKRGDRDEALLRPTLRAGGAK